MFFRIRLPILLGRLGDTFLSLCSKAFLTDGCMVTCILVSSPKDLFSTWSRMLGGEAG
jgi:hypothetical protein